MKKTLSIILTLCMLCGAVIAVLPMTASAAAITANTDWYEANKDAKAYTLQNEAELLGFAQLANATPDIGAFEGWTIKLARDMDLNPGWVASASAPETTWINNNDDYFKGTFDGCGYTISGLYTNNSGKNNLGFLVGMSGVSTVKNLAIVNSYFGAKRAAAICPGSGKVEGGITTITISNCYVDAIVVGADAAGGIVGANVTNKSAGDTITVSGCVFAGTVTSTNKYVGGIVGNSNGNVTNIDNCINLGDVTGVSNIGGILGRAGSSDTITNCINLGFVKSTDSSGLDGEILGNAKSGNSIDLSNCYWVNANGKERAYKNEDGNGVINGTETVYKTSVGELAAAVAANAAFTDWAKVDNSFLVLPTDVATTFAAELESVVAEYRVALYAQKSTDETALRFVGVVALDEAALADYEKLSFDVAMVYNNENYGKVVDTTTVYKSIMVEGAPVAASTYGGTGFFVIEVTGLDGITATDAEFTVSATLVPADTAPTYAKTASYTWELPEATA